jgi:hypothetical protein
MLQKHTAMADTSNGKRSGMHRTLPSSIVRTVIIPLIAVTLSTGCPGSSNNNAPPPSQSPNGGGANLVGVFTYHNDNLRTGQNLTESVLTPTNVKAASFGLLFSNPVDGLIYAQPLYVAGLNIGGQVRDVVFVATEHDSVYAFDADRPGPPLWHTSFINSAAGIRTISSADVNCTQIVPEIGITSTPVIDPNSGILYVTAATNENGALVHRIHALDVITGTDKIPPVLIQGAVPGNGDGSINGLVTFDSTKHLQRPALLLSQNALYIAFGSNCDIPPYHGWVFAYDAQNLNQLGLFNATPNGGDGAIWQSGGGPSADANGNIFVMTGNGTFNGPPPSPGNNDFGDSFVKLTGATLQVADFFTPFNQAILSSQDDDLGSGAPLLLPDQNVGPPHLMVSAGKEGTIYLINRDNMGKFNANSDQIVKSIPRALGGGEGLFSTPAYFQNMVYFLGAEDVLRAFSLSNGQLGVLPTSQAASAFGFRGATPVISANGPNNGIVWVIQNDQAETSGPAVLHAYLATDVSTELYNSNQNLSRDNPGPAVKFTLPTVFNGKVFVGTQTQLSVFGLLP